MNFPIIPMTSFTIEPSMFIAEILRLESAI